MLPQEKPKRKKAPFDCLIKPQVAPSSGTPLFEADGFLHLRGFAAAEECAAMEQRMRALVEGWDPRCAQGRCYAPC